MKKPDIAAVRQRARRHGQADARARRFRYEHLYPNGHDGCADYWLGRQEVEMPAVDRVDAIHASGSVSRETPARSRGR